MSIIDHYLLIFCALVGMEQLDPRSCQLLISSHAVPETFSYKTTVQLGL